MKKHSIIKSVAVVTVFSVATRFFSFLFKIYVSRTLGAEAMGLYQMALSVYLLLFSLAASGLPVVLSRRIAEDNAADGKNIPSLLSAAVIICLSAAAFIVAGFYIFKDYLKNMFADPRAMELLLIMLPALLSTSLYITIRSWFWGKSNFNTFSFSEMMEELFRIAFTIIFTSELVSAISPLKGLALGFLLADIVCVSVLLIMFLRRNGRFGRPFGFKPLLVSSLPVTTMKTFGGLVSSLTAIVIPAMLVAAGMTTSGATAMYGRVAGMAMPLLMAPTTLTGALAVVLIPEIAAASSKNDEAFMRTRIEGSVVFSLLIASFFCILFLPLGQEVSEIVFADSEAGQFLSNSAILLYPIGLNQLSLSMLNSLGMEKKSFINYVIGTAFLVLSLFLLPRWTGIYAVAIGSGICFTITSFLNLRMISKRVSLFDSIKKPALAVVFMPPLAGLAYLLKMLLLPFLPKFIAVVLSGGIPMLLYILIMASFKIIDVSRLYQRKKRRVRPLIF